MRELDSCDALLAAEVILRAYIEATFAFPGFENVAPGQLQTLEQGLSGYGNVLPI